MEPFTRKTSSRGRGEPFTEGNDFTSVRPGNFVKRGSAGAVSAVSTRVPPELKERAVRGSGRWFQGLVLDARHYGVFRQKSLVS